MEEEAALFSGLDIVFDSNKDSFIVKTSRRSEGQISRIGESDINEAFNQTDVLEVLKSFDFNSEIILSNKNSKNSKESSSSSKIAGAKCNSRGGNIYNLRAIKVPDGRLGLVLCPVRSYSSSNDNDNDNDDDDDDDNNDDRENIAPPTASVSSSSRRLHINKPCKGLIITGVSSDIAADDDNDNISPSSRISSSTSSSSSRSGNNSTLMRFCLEVGDKIVSVNGISITELTVEAATSLLSRAQNRILLIVKENRGSSMSGSNAYSNSGTYNDEEGSKTKQKKRKSDPQSEETSELSREYRRIKGNLVEHYLRKKHKTDSLLILPLSSQISSNTFRCAYGRSSSSNAWTSLSRSFANKFNSNSNMFDDQ